VQLIDDVIDPDDVGDVGHHVAVPDHRAVGCFGGWVARFGCRADDLRAPDDVE
jgi:hypothetical protein